MTEDSKQLSVAELLARNGQQGAASSGGGRRRRGSRSVSVAELTGDLPVIREGGGHSAHAAPDSGAEEPAEAEEPAAASSSFDPPAPVSYAPQPAPDPSVYSPMSGPISIYDPLAGYAQPEPPRTDNPPRVDNLGPGWSSRVMPGREMPSDTRRGVPLDPLSSDTPVSELFSAAPGASAPDPQFSAAVPETPPRSRRRRRQDEPEEEATEERGWHESQGREVPPDSRAADLGRTHHTEFDEPGLGRSEPGRSHGRPERNGVQGGRAARRRAAEAAEAAEELGPATAAWSPATGGFAAESEPPPDARPKPGRPPLPDPHPQAHRNGSRSNAAGENGLPAWSARRHKGQAPARDAALDSGAIPTSAWSLASQDQQLVSGPTVAGDLLRDGVERAERAAALRGRRGGERSVVDAGELDGATDVYEPIELDDEDDEDEAAERPRAISRRSRAGRNSEYEANRRQWMILGGQSAGAVIAGMLLFKGFERMWEMLPWVALALAMIAILGLVALVRILRRTDDILSTVIAVVVGIFVTLGPLAFLLNTN
ncbi:hypothetical protein [Nocardia sp. R6R-6]|uniref:hypothetical protein n=1 Tax=Nocardia sp. R6R-6 TaxID=3459303 RepID=UPI00403E1286